MNRKIKAYPLSLALIGGVLLFCSHFLVAFAQTPTPTPSISDSAPVITPIPDQTVSAGGSLYIPISISDPDGNSFSSEVVLLIENTPSSLPAGVLYQPEFEEFQWQTNASQVGMYIFRVRATDGVNTSEDIFQVQVIGPPS